MPQITRELIAGQVAQLVEAKGKQLAALNATLGALEFAQKCLTFIDLPDPVDSDGSEGVALESETDLCGTTTTPACGTSSTTGTGA